MQMIPPSNLTIDQVFQNLYVSLLHFFNLNPCSPARNFHLSSVLDTVATLTAATFTAVTFATLASFTSAT